MPEREHGFDEEVATETRERLKKTPLFRVLLHNDDFTTMEFVVEVLKKVFGKTDGDAFRIMWAVHTQGVGCAGVWLFCAHKPAATKSNRRSFTISLPYQVST